MTASAKRKLFLGIIVLALFCFGLFLYFNYASSVVTAQTAQLKTNTYNVGTTYAGQITKQFVNEGDKVKTGQKLFQIKSTKLLTQIANPDFDKKQLQHKLTKNKQLVITATNPGVVQNIKATQGSFVPDNSVLATIAQTKNLQAEANVKLSPDQYAEIGPASHLIVTVPSGQTVTCPISNISIVNQHGQVLAKIDCDLDSVQYNSLTTQDGTPVIAKLQVKQPLWYTWYRDTKDLIL